MCEVAGRMAVQAGAHCLEKPQGGMGMLLGGVAGRGARRKIVILGARRRRHQRRADGGGHAARGSS